MLDDRLRGLRRGYPFGISRIALSVVVGLDSSPAPARNSSLHQLDFCCRDLHTHTRRQRVSFLHRCFSESDRQGMSLTFLRYRRDDSPGNADRGFDNRVERAVREPKFIGIERCPIRAKRLLAPGERRCGKHSGKRRMAR